MTTTVNPMSSATWIPEDDLLLKNAVEAGASLEALAKGAVQFSRRFTLQELRDRWHSLLYDPDISVQASVQMFQLELSGSNLSFKFNRSDNSKGSNEITEKRKLGTIHKQYYTMHKKIRSGLFATDMDFFSEANCHNYNGFNGNFQGRGILNDEPQIATSVREYSFDHFELKETDFDIQHNAFPETRRDIASTGALEDNQPSRPVREDNCLYGITGDLTGKDVLGSFEINTEHEGICGTADDKTMNYENCQEVKEHEPSDVLPNKSYCEADDSEMKPFSTSVSINDDSQTVCSVFGGKHHFNSPNSHGSDPFCTFWKDDIPAPSMPANVVATQDEEGTSKPSDEGNDKETSAPTYEVEHSVPLVKDSHAGTDFVNSAAISDGELADLSDSLLDFSNENLLFLTDVDGKDKTDLPCTEKPSQLSVSYPNDIIDIDGRNVEHEISIVPNTCTDPSFDACSAETRFVSPVTRELNDTNTYCMLNTEDPEIPCNDDIFLLIHPSIAFTSSAMHSNTITVGSLSSAPTRKDTEQKLDLTKKGREPAQSVKWSQIVGPNILPERVSRPLVVDSAVKSELSTSNCKNSHPRDANNSLGDSSQFKFHAMPDNKKERLLKQYVTQFEFGVVALPTEYGDKQLLTEAGPAEKVLQKPVINLSTSDQEKSESDNDIPYFSDIEAMILEMDLDPHEQDSHMTTSWPVSRYQHEDAKRAIIRLEQCAHSSLHRAMTARGAFAVLYGRHLKHYIKKTEIMLGRSTEDVDVDIDLRKEGRANKISRRQAIIKMGKDGSFFLKNLGKCSISVNGKSIANGQLLSLSTSCLIEIRGMCFMFEINEKYVRQYLDKLIMKRNYKHSNFEWSGEEGPRVHESY